MHTAESAVGYIYIIVWLFVDSEALRRSKTEVLLNLHIVYLFHHKAMHVCDHSLILFKMNTDLVSTYCKYSFTP